MDSKAHSVGCQRRASVSALILATLFLFSTTVWCFTGVEAHIKSVNTANEVSHHIEPAELLMGQNKDNLDNEPIKRTTDFQGMSFTQPH
jgi:hypothetical protein